jgi:hypothetical protein
VHEGLGQLLAEGVPAAFQWLADMLLDPSARIRRIGCFGLVGLVLGVAAAVHWLA